MDLCINKLLLHTICVDLWVRLVAEASTKGDGGAVELGGDQTELIFLGTGTSEGVPRVSCLTNPLHKCEVHNIIQHNHVHVIIDEWIWHYGMESLGFFIGFGIMIVGYCRCVQKLLNRVIRIGDLTQASSFVTPIPQEHTIIFL